jgi:hypothetical protein
MKRLFFPLILVLFVTLACGCTSNVVSTLQATNTAQPVLPSDTVAPTNTSVPTNTTLPTATNTQKPTYTPRPTATRIPTATARPTPAILTGMGSDVVDNPWVGFGLLHITYTGRGNFAITSYDENNQYMDLLVNTIGSYEGTVPLDFEDGSQTARFQVEASGPWTIEIRPLEMIRIETIPGTFTGKSDDIIAFKGGKPDLLKANASGNSNFVIWSYSDNGLDLVVNEIAPWSGTVMVDNTTAVIQISASGPWSIEVTTR